MVTELGGALPYCVFLNICEELSSVHSTATTSVLAEQCYVVMNDVTFATDALLPTAQQPLYVRDLYTVNATVCSNTCREAKNAAWPAASGRTVIANCSLWRYCTNRSGCPSSSALYSPLGFRICQLQSF